jgi:protein subunit release factor A
MKLLEDRVNEYLEQRKARDKKAERDERIHNTERVRTYDYSRGVVTDHRTGKIASLKDILVKGLLDKLR